MHRSLDYGGAAKNINAPAVIHHVGGFEGRLLFRIVDVARAAARSVHALCGKRSRGGELISGGALPMLISMVFPLHYSHKCSPDFHSDFMAHQDVLQNTR